VAPLGAGVAEPGARSGDAYVAVIMCVRGAHGTVGLWQGGGQTSDKQQSRAEAENRALCGLNALEKTRQPLPRRKTNGCMRSWVCAHDRALVWQPREVRSARGWPSRQCHTRRGQHGALHGGMHVAAAAAMP